MDFLVVVCFSAAAFAGLLGGFVVLREPRAVAAWAFFVGMLALAAESAFSGLTTLAVLPDRILFWQTLCFVPLAVLPVAWLVFGLTYSRADYRECLRSWRVVLWGQGLGALACIAGGFRKLVGVYVPPGGHSSAWLVTHGVPANVLHVLLIAGAVLVLTTLERTFRTAVGMMRWRIKFMVLSIGSLMAVRIYTSSQALLYSSASSTLAALNAGALILCGLVAARALARARLLNLDLYVSHAVLYRSTTVLLCGLYLVVIGLLAQLFKLLGGIPHFPLKTFVVFAGILGLGALLASDRVRLHSKRFVSRHFKRPQYDYRGVWTTFSQSTAGLMNHADFCGEVVRMVSETFEALSVSIWLIDSTRGVVFGASTSLTREKAQALLDDCRGIKTVIAGSREEREPFDLDTAGKAYAEPLRQINPGSFPTKGGHRFFVPLPGGSGLQGLMVVGDRVRGIPFTAEEIELLKTMGEQAGAGLLNIELSESLLEAKQMEAFQTMSTFFVHDLKNTASTLSLMLQNLPTHFDDPEFRTDALGTISRSVTRIDSLIGRLSELRKCVSVETAPADLNRLTESVISGLGEAVSANVRQDLDPALSPIPLDSAQMQKVITNLVLNAVDASGEDAGVCVSTARSNGFARLTVSDKGRGMTREFVEKDLFKPFRSTKKEGVGIGLFQSKMIVEAHRGRIEVESEVEKGSVFRVFLPVSAQAAGESSTSNIQHPTPNVQVKGE